MGTLTITYEQVGLFVAVWGAVIMPFLLYGLRRFKTLQQEISRVDKAVSDKIDRGQASKLIADSIGGLERSVDQLHQDIRILLTSLIEKK